MSRLFSFLLVIFLICGGIFFWSAVTKDTYHELLDAVVATDGTTQKIEIPAGSGPAAIGTLLAREGMILDADVFLRYVKEQGFDRKLQAGSFYVSSSMTIPEVVDVLLGQKTVKEERLTIPEGMRIRDIDDLLATKGLIEAGSFIACTKTCSFSFDFLPANGSLEGYLFPDTYNIVPEAFVVEEFIERMLQNFDRRMTAQMRADIKDSGLTLAEVVNMASIVERESTARDDRSVVAGVLWNRYHAKQLIGADATLLYERDDVRAPITYQELQANSPYNTRKNVGLPPTPISNPGMAALQAAAYPAETEYWYYLHDPSGQIHFGKTLSEHNRNKALYLK